MAAKIINYKNLNIENIKFTEIVDNPRVNSQKIGYIKYLLDDETETQLKVKTPQFKGEAYGIPREGPYYPDAKSRAKYKLAFCQDRHLHDDINYTEIEEFMNLLVSIDEMCDTDAFRKKNFGEKEFDKYAYQPLIRVPEKELDDNGVEKYRPPYTQIKLDLEYSADPDNQTTKPTFAIAELKNGKRSSVELETFEDAVKMLKYLNKMRFIISFNKIYAQKKASGTGKNAKKTYGITLKATNIEVEQSNYAVASSDNQDAFESDTEDAVQNDKNLVKITRDQTLKQGNLDEDVEDEQEDQDQDKEEQEEIVEEPPVKQKTVAKSATATTTKKSAKSANK